MNTRLVFFIFFLGFSFLQAQSSTEIPEIVFVEGGSFQMGSNETEEGPIHEVSVDNFSLGKYEVTVGQYRKFCGETGKQMPKEPSWGWKDNHPIVNVNWEDAVAYCDWLKGKDGGEWRLPTEAEWEFAARGGKKAIKTRFSGGDNMANLGWYKKNSDMHPHPVGQKAPNELGLYDMSGNAREWCKDLYSNTYDVSSTKNPQGSETGSFHSLRGGSWYLDESFQRVSARSIRLMHGRSDYSLGFRVAKSEE